MKGIIKLYPVNHGKITTSSIVLYNNMRFTIDEVIDGRINGTIPIDKVKLLKYFVTNKKGIVGELEYNQYDLVKENQCVDYNYRKTLAKMEIGDEVELFKLSLNQFCQFSNSFANKVTGTIININGRTATVDIHGSADVILAKRHKLKLLKGNERKICKVLVKD